MKTVTDFQGNTYSLEQVVAVLRGGTPHTDLPLPRKPVAILVYASGARIETLVPYSEVLLAWLGPPAPKPGAPGIIDAPAGLGLVDAEAQQQES